MARDTHEKSDLRFSVLSTEENWFKRAIAIKKIKPTLNKDQGRYHLSKVYDKFIRTSVNIKTSRNGATNPTEERHF